MSLSAELSLSLLILLPLLGAVLILITGRNAFLRDMVSVVVSLLLVLNVAYLVSLVAAGQRPALNFLNIGGVSLSLKLEPLGALFAAVASGLWVLNTFFTIGYMRGNQEKNQTRFFAFVCIAIAATMGVAASGDILSLFLFYEALSLSTFPLVAHKGDQKSRKGAKVYLLVLMGTSLGLFLPAVVATYAFAGSGDFISGGLLNGHVSSGIASVLLILYVFGIGKAALMPVHSWLPNAMVAPTPVSALLHAVAVVKAGVFSILKVSIFIFGTEVLQKTAAANWLSWVAIISIVLASCIALSKDNLKARLAYSTVSQLSYVTLGAMLAVTSGFRGAALQIVMHAWGKITLFMAAGAIYTIARRTHVSQLRGLGRSMPLTMLAFMIGAASIIGLPPMGGSWPKFFLMLGSLDAGHTVFLIALMLSSVLNVLYLMPIPARAFFLSGPPLETGESLRKNGLLWVPPLLTALGAFLLFFFAGRILAFLDPVLTETSQSIGAG